MNDSAEKIYRYHHEENRVPEFVVFGKERGGFLKQRIGQGKTILDLGCRDGSLAKYFLEGNQVVGIDVDEEALKRASALGISTKKMDLNGSWDELDENKFDVVVAAEVLEHLYFPEMILKKIGKVLKPGGIFLGSVPNAFSLKNRMRLLFGNKKNTTLSDPTHINHFDFKELKCLLSKDFSNVEIISFIRKPFNYLTVFSQSLFSFLFIFSAKKKDKQ